MRPFKFDHTGEYIADVGLVVLKRLPDYRRPSGGVRDLYAALCMPCGRTVVVRGATIRKGRVKPCAERPHSDAERVAK